MTEFKKIIPVSCLQGSGLVLPCEFRDAVVKQSGSYILQNSQGEQWPCTITRKMQVKEGAEGGHERADITGGWRPYAHANGFQAGDEILVKYLGNGVLQVTKTGKTGTPSRPGGTPRPTKTPAAKTPAKTPASGSGRASTGTKAKRRPASATPASGGVAKRRGSSSTGRRRGAAAVEEEVAVLDGAVLGEALPMYMEPAGEYMQPIWPTWCAIM